MTQDEFNAYCRSFKATKHVVQWGGADVWKVVDKVFAIAWWHEDKEPAITFKVSEIAYEVLREQPGLQPAPYMASRGMKWIQHFDKPGMNDDDLKSCLADSYRIVSLGLTKKKQREFGLNQSEASE